MQHDYQDHFLFCIFSYASVDYFEENAKLFASLIARKAKDIDALINSLPSAECSPEIQVRLSHLSDVEPLVITLCALCVHGRQIA